MKDLALECIERKLPSELRELNAPLKSFQELLKFVEQPRGWQRRSRNQTCGKDGQLRVSFEEFVDGDGNWSLQLDHYENAVRLRPLRLHLMPKLEDSVVRVKDKELEALSSAAVKAHLNSGEQSAASLAAFRDLTARARRRHAA